MAEGLNTEFQEMSEDIFAALMGDTPPETTVNTNTLKGTTKAETTENKEVEEKEVEQPTKTQEEIDAEINEATDDVTDDNHSDFVETDFFKNKALGLIERGIWQEFEEPEGWEWNEENYGKLAEIQAEWKAEEKYEERVGRVGDIGKTILEHIEAGGNPEEIIELFKVSKKVEGYDTSTNEGREQVLKEYYTKVLNWNEAKATKHIKLLVDSGEANFKEESEDAKAAILDGIKNQVEQTKEAEKQKKIDQIRQAQEWENNMSRTIKERTDLTEKEKQDVQKALLVYNQKLPDGRVVNNFTVEFMKIQSDPKKYIDLVRFITNPEKFISKVEKKAEATAAKKTWDLIKGNGALNRNSGSTSHNKNEKPKNDLVIDYKKLLS